MSRNIKNIFSLIILFLVGIVLAGCVIENNGDDEKDKYEHHEFTLYSAFTSPNSVQIWALNETDETKFADLVTTMNKTLKDLDRKFNVQDRKDGVVTDLMRINQNAGISPVEVDQEVIDVIKLAIEIGEETIVNGVALYDVTISPVWQLWDFPNKPAKNDLGFPVFYDIPTQEEIDEVLQLVDYKKIIINEEYKTVFLPLEGMGIDLGSIVKGYAADKLKTNVLDYGIEKAIIDVGRNILLVGSFHDSEDITKAVPFKVGIATPYYDFSSDETKGKKSTFASFGSSDKTLVTSGSYEKYIMSKKGKEYHHILDPRTGYPFDNNVVSISVITDESIKGDGYSTALFSLGLKKGMELIKQKGNIEAVWVVKNGSFYDVYITEGLEESFIFNELVTSIGFRYKGVYR